MKLLFLHLDLNVLKIRRKATCLPSILPALFENVLSVLI